MKKFVIVSIAALAVFLIQDVSQAQMLKIGLTGGLTNISSPDSYSNSVSNNGYGFGSNFHFGAQARIDLPLVPINPIIFIDYHMLKGDGDRNSVHINTSQNILSIGAEGEYIILPLPLVKPYISLDVTYNKFGELKEESPLQTVTQGGFTRYGGGIGIGAVITVLPVIDLDVSLKYQTLNLVGKADGENNVSLTNLSVAVIF